MSESELVNYIADCYVLHPHNCTKANLFALRQGLINFIIDNSEAPESQKRCSRYALAEAFGRCASSAPVPQRTIEPSCRRPSEFAFSGEKLAEAGV